MKRALVSVYHKDGLDEILRKLHSEGVTFVSTGGTQSFIESLGLPCDAVEDLTSYPSILGGRVKTLHPKVFGGILARRDNEGDQKQLAEYEIPEIDLVIVDLYPFEETVASGAEEQAIIEKIDIGGISLIRAAAKNFKDVVIVASKAQYQPLMDLLNEKGAETTLEERKWFAKEAFAVSSGYDSAIFNYFDDRQGSHFRAAVDAPMHLRYGENPHQPGKFYGRFNEMFEQVHGKEISYNNLLDIDAAVNLIDEFDELTFAILKHNNACGIASRGNVLEAWKDALAGDPVSAFGGILITNTTITKEVAEEINKIFFDTKTFARLKLEARLTAGIELYAGGMVGLCTLPQRWIDELSISEDDIDSISGFARSIEGVEIGIMIREVEGGMGKLSLRTSPRYDACALCQQLGGGGHAAAAGASVAGGIEGAKKAILDVLAQSGIRL